jgi:hypothetical protein
MFEEQVERRLTGQPENSGPTCLSGKRTSLAGAELSRGAPIRRPEVLPSKWLLVSLSGEVP